LAQFITTGKKDERIDLLAVVARDNDFLDAVRVDVGDVKTDILTVS
jgi:hypothetical protein